MRKLTYILPVLLLAVLFSSCRTDFEVYAPEQEIYVVYGVLNPQDTVQYVRISRAYQSENSAYRYASENDLSREGLVARISGNGATYQGIPVTDLPKDSTGLFLPSQTVYKFVTDGSPGSPLLAGGARYDLRIEVAGREDAVKAFTVIPDAPDVKEPFSPFPGAGLQQCIAELPLHSKVAFEWANVEGVICSDRTIGYEMRIKFRYQENGVDKELVYGPEAPQKCNEGCQTSNSRICKQFGEREILNYFKQRMPEAPNLNYTYDNAPDCDNDVANLPQSLEVEVTAIDEFLTNYMEVNSPAVTDLTGARLEYSNIESDELYGVGVFGSINTASEFYIMKPCAEYILDLNNTPQPFTACTK